MSKGANRFYNSVDGASELAPRDLVELFVYYLTVEAGESAASAKAVDACFEVCDLPPPKRTAAHLSEGVTSKPQRYVKVDGGYKLQRHRREGISKRLGAERVVVQTSAELRRLEERLSDGPKKAFLKETIDCFEAGANRATVVMCWLLTLDHLYELVITSFLSAFNAELAKVKDRRVKVSMISTKDDFSDIPEGKFIELLRATGVISNDVRKILDAKLGIRNTCAHPSGVTIKRSKVIDFVEDLIENVILKYPV